MRELPVTKGLTGVIMPILYVLPSSKPSQEEREHNRALFERYMPEFMEYYLDVRLTLGARIGGELEFHIPDSDLPFVQSIMDDTKRLVM